MNFFRKLLHIPIVLLRALYKIYCLLVFAISMICIYPFFKILYISKRGWPIAFRLMRFYAKLILFFMFIPVRLKKPMPELPDGPYLICSNHSSFVDIPCLYFLFRKYFTFVGKKEIAKWPLFRVFYTSGMNILVDRNDKSGAGSSFKRMLWEIDMKHPLFMFPEGTITKNAPFMGDFKEGAFRIAVQKQIPIVPVSFLNNYKRMERKGFFSGYASPGFCNAIIHQPISTIGMSKKDIPLLMDQVKQIISEPIFAKN